MTRRFKNKNLRTETDHSYQRAQIPHFFMYFFFGVGAGAGVGGGGDSSDQSVDQIFPRRPARHGMFV